MTKWVMEDELLNFFFRYLNFLFRYNLYSHPFLRECESDIFFMSTNVFVGGDICDFAYYETVKDNNCEIRHCFV